MASLQEREIWARRIPGAPGIDSAAAVASANPFPSPRILVVTTAGTFDFVTLAGTARANVALPVGIYPCYLSALTAINGGGAGELISQ